MKLITGKYHLLISGSKYKHLWDLIGKGKIWEENKVKFLGIYVDNSLKVDTHNNVCTKANQKMF